MLDLGLGMSRGTRNTIYLVDKGPDIALEHSAAGLSGLRLRTAVTKGLQATATVVLVLLVGYVTWLMLS